MTDEEKLFELTMSAYSSNWETYRMLCIANKIDPEDVYNVFVNRYDEGRLPIETEYINTEEGVMIIVVELPFGCKLKMYYYPGDSTHIAHLKSYTKFVDLKGKKALVKYRYYTNKYYYSARTGFKHRFDTTAYYYWDQLDSDNYIRELDIDDFDGEPIGLIEQTTIDELFYYIFEAIKTIYHRNIKELEY